MKLRGNMKINKGGILEIGGMGIDRLIEKHGTPLIVIDEAYFRDITKDYYRNFTEKTNGKARVLFASKAFLSKATCSIVNSLGLGLDAVSGGELFLINDVGFPMEKVVFHGNNKSKEELEMAIRLGVGRIVVDNEFELKFLSEIAREQGVIVNIFLRITPGVEAHTHEFIKTGHIDSKFGFTLQNGDALIGVKQAIKDRNLRLLGLHAHIGSQIFDMKGFEFTSEVMMDFIKKIKDETSYEIEELDLGGGFGIYYTDEDSPNTIENYSDSIIDSVRKKANEHKLKVPFLYVEPGRSLIGPTGTSLYTIGSIKEIKGINKYIAVDGGMSDCIRPALYDAKYEFALGNRMKDKPEELVAIVGKCCESGDYFSKGTMLPKALTGDILVMAATGAYGYSMASNYNMMEKPEVVLVSNGESDVIIKRETYGDLIKNQVIPERLK